MSDGVVTGAENSDPPLPALVGPWLRTHAVPSPKKIVFSYDPDEFEEFVKEWVPALETKYVAVQRHGGSGDHGVDVAGYLTSDGLEGAWHNYQCKHYGDALTWSKAAPEMRKMFASVVGGHFTVPEQYVFVAPIIGPRLVRRLSKKTEAKAEFLKELASTRDPVITSLVPELRRELRELAEATDFSMFTTIDMDEMLSLHQTTPHWAVRFPQPPAPRPQRMLPPDAPTPVEARYIQQLIRAYGELWGEQADSLERIAEHDEARAHLRRQREAFYSAESLRLFARDSTSDGHFDAVLDDVHDIVVEVAAGRFEFGYDRMQAVLAASGNVELTKTILTEFVRPLDRKGVCHHLANADRLIWCRGGAA
ncbi:ABC-three component system protein [Kitasatospora sp. NPDC127116]|uniref:ABC-three component system protein n=1 Tax=Kitasatospora sp. NPDC127116 TaxID=3345367 RepID=UPI00338AF490